MQRQMSFQALDWRRLKIIKSCHQLQQALVQYEVIDEKFGQIWVIYKRRREKVLQKHT